ncbi:hypothetical protein [Flavobacterium tructae]|uniref:DUF4476 domain-containing protein n=1 Tax=Flavobacterium tructae TaxID=1114873 RepID=A0A1S1JFC1_9FLAO|nr:hypothetical protein [Flavobacterium tructae]OHT46933.1 hypothetical protein BHE19_05365 [Flavobacterium tructae]OXB21240.1 hypothetical protein B0A71_06545 [Flavobacterium tructae]
MKKLKTQTLLVFVLCLFIPLIGNAQTSTKTVPMPSQQNKIIIDKIVEAVRYKSYVTDFCLATISEAVLKEKWNDQKTIEITESIDYKNFRDAVYNMFAFYNEIELETLLKTYQKDTVYQTTNVMVTNDALGYNLEIFANDIVRGRYK